MDLCITYIQPSIGFDETLLVERKTEMKALKLFHSLQIIKI
jgi:hypothetical protein